MIGSKIICIIGIYVDDFLIIGLKQCINEIIY